MKLMVLGFDKLGCGIEKTGFFFVMVVIYGMFFTGVPFLVAFIGAIVIGFSRVVVSVDSEFFHVVRGVTFLVCTYFCYLP